MYFVAAAGVPSDQAGDQVERARGKAVGAGAR